MKLGPFLFFNANIAFETTGFPTTLLPFTTDSTTTYPTDLLESLGCLSLISQDQSLKIVLKMNQIFFNRSD